MTAEAGLGQSHKPGAGEPSAMAPARLRRLNRWLVEGLREDLAVLYMRSRTTPSRDPNGRPSRQNFLNRLTEDMRRPGFAMVIAETDSLRGCAFGFPVGGGSWWLGFDGALPRSIEQLTVSGNVFAFAGILVRGPAGATTFRALVLPLGERTTARLEGLVTMPGGGGLSVA